MIAEGKQEVLIRNYFVLFIQSHVSLWSMASKGQQLAVLFIIHSSLICLAACFIYFTTDWDYVMRTNINSMFAPSPCWYLLLWEQYWNRIFSLFVDMGWGECVKAIRGEKIKTVLCRISLSQVVGWVGFVCTV